jgi:hypothetical protein
VTHLINVDGDSDDDNAVDALPSFPVIPSECTVHVSMGSGPDSKLVR